jgi:hypothetical protein
LVVNDTSLMHVWNMTFCNVWGVECRQNASLQHMLVTV